jgi:very-short-patch-repair endonuclease
MTKTFARLLRSSMTDAEMRLWMHLRLQRKSGLAFRRQSPVGAYVLDFECRPARLGIELDGAHHLEPEKRAHDEKRQDWLRQRGYMVLRYWNADVLRDAQPILDEIIVTARRRIADRYGPGR